MRILPENYKDHKIIESTHNLWFPGNNMDRVVIHVHIAVPNILRCILAHLGGFFRGKLHISR
jgi:hypothetical protein